MRMWMVNPAILCTKHLGGEHLEIHMFLGTLRKKMKVSGYIKNNLLEPLSLHQRHDVLASELVRRKFMKEKKHIEHATPISEQEVLQCIQYLDEESRNHRINNQDSLLDLIYRCPQCYYRYQRLLKELGSKFDPLDSWCQHSSDNGVREYLSYDFCFDFEKESFYGT